MFCFCCIQVYIRIALPRGKTGKLENKRKRRKLTGLEVLEENVPLLALLAPIPDDNARAIDDLSGFSFTIQCTYTH